MYCWKLLLPAHASRNSNNVMIVSRTRWTDGVVMIMLSGTVVVVDDILDKEGKAWYCAQWTIEVKNKEWCIRENQYKA